MVLLIIFSVLAGIIELPLCCTCFQCCRAIGDKMTFFKHFLMRALMYAAFAASLIAVQVVQENSAAGWTLGILNGINAVLYVIAHCTGETPGDEAAEEGVARWALLKLYAFAFFFMPVSPTCMHLMFYLVTPTFVHRT